MSGAKSLAPMERHRRMYNSGGFATGGWRRRHRAGVGVTHNKRRAEDEIADFDNGLQMTPDASDEMSGAPQSDTDSEPTRKSDAEVTAAHNTTFPHSAPMDIE
jgi:hypothetical protein